MEMAAYPTEDNPVEAEQVCLEALSHTWSSAQLLQFHSGPVVFSTEFLQTNQNGGNVEVTQSDSKITD